VGDGFCFHLGKACWVESLVGDGFTFLGGGFLASVRVDKLFPVKTTHPMDSQKGPVFLFPLVECFKWLGIHLVVIAFSWASF